MNTLKEYVKQNIKTDNLMDEYYHALKDKDFKLLRDLINLDDKTLSLYTSNIQDSSKEYANCTNCKGLANCSNQIKGYVYFPTVIGDTISFNYKACKYQEKELSSNKYQKNIEVFNTSESIKNAKIKEIYISKERKEVIEYINNYYKNFGNLSNKGLYLYGNFGCGKTYIIASLFNELAKKNIRSVIIYYPEFLRTLKSSFTNNPEEISFEDKFNYIKKAPLLLLDDIGAENTTPWGRDEILGTILQYRMEEDLPTFFTSNLSLEELENHLSISKEKTDLVKARRIIERIKYLSNEMKLIDINRRNKNE